MDIVDNTIDKNFRELETGNCFTLWSSYYMKIRVPYYDDYSNVEDYKYLAVNLSTGFVDKIPEGEKVRLINTKLVID